MNGAEVAVEIRRRWPGMPYLFVTGYADHAALANDGAVGEDRIVQKPFRDGELEGKAAAILSARTGPSLRLVSSRPAG